MDELLKTIREGCGPALWSRGVEWARQNLVSGVKDGDALVFRVKVPGVAVTPVATLLPVDGDWHCTCPSDDDPCAHVAAAVIAWKKSRDLGQELPRSEAAGGKVVYRLLRQSGRLAFERWVLPVNSSPSDTGGTRLSVSLAALASGRAKGPATAATSFDLEVDLALSEAGQATGPSLMAGGVLPAAAWPKVFATLARAAANGSMVTLDGEAVSISAVPLGLVALVTDDGPAVNVRLVTDPRIQETFGNGVCLTPDGLCPHSPPALHEVARRALMERGKTYGRHDFAELAATILPRLAQDLGGDDRLLLRAAQLPGLARGALGRPRILATLAATPDAGLRVTTALVYGQPPVARVDDGRLVFMDPATPPKELPRRDVQREKELETELSRRHNLTIGGSTAFTGDRALALVEELSRSPVRDLDAVGDGLQAFAFKGQLAPELRLSSDGSFRLEFHLSGALAPVTSNASEPQVLRADPAQVLAAWRGGASLVPLLDGQGLAELPRSWLAQHGHQVLDLLASRQLAQDGHGVAQGRLSKAHLPLALEMARELSSEVPPALSRLEALLGPEGQLPEHPLPAGTTVTLRPYQRLGINWLAVLKSEGLGGLLADDMGLGKTLQALMVLTGPALIVAPTSVLFNWAKEMRRFRPDLRLCLYHGPARRIDAEAEVVLTTYTTLRLDLAQLTQAAGGGRWSALVMDEAQVLKNPDSQIRQAMGQVAADFRLALTGTPVENRLTDLYSLMDILNPGIFGDRRDFEDRYATAVMSPGEARARLRSRIKPFLLRRVKGDVLKDLPPRTEAVLHVELSAAERERYEVVRAAARRDVLAQLGGSVNALAALEALLRLRQACCHPDLLPGVDGETSSKLQLLVQTLDTATAEGHKVLVFSQWTSFLDLMEPALRAAGLTFLRLDGSTSDRQGVVERFQDASGPGVLIMSLKAGGVGLNLTAADQVIITDPWWNPAAEDQAADRAHRIGQTRPVLVQRLVALNTVEERILALQESKRAIARAAVGTDDGTVRSELAAPFTRDDLLALLGDS